MAQESQQLPPWMTLVSSVLTDSNGEPTATSFTTLQLPLTYYGPSVSALIDLLAGLFVWGCDMPCLGGIVRSMSNGGLEKVHRVLRLS